MQLLIIFVAIFSKHFFQETYSTSHFSFPLQKATRVLNALLNRYRYGCAHLIRTEIEGIAEINITFQFWKILQAQDIFSTVLDVQDINRTWRKPTCFRGRSINIVIIQKNSTCHYLHVLLADSMWLLFLPDQYSRNVLGKMRAPFQGQIILAEFSRGEDSFSLKNCLFVDPTVELNCHDVGYLTASGFQWTTEKSFLHQDHLHGIVLKAGITHLPPFSKLEEQDGRTMLVGGFFGRVWHILEENLNFTTELIESSDSSWEVKPDENGSWSEMTNLLIDGTVDILINDVSMSNQKSELMDFLLPFFTVSYQIFIREPSLLDLDWKIFFSPLGTSMWVGLVITMLLLCCHLSLVHHCGRYFCNEEADGPSQYHIRESLLYVFGAFCQQAHEHTPRATSCRLVFISCYLTALVVLTSYSTIYVSFMTVRKFSLPFTDLTELLKDGTYQFGTVDESPEQDYFQTSTDPLIREIYSRLMAPDSANFPVSDEEALQRICNHRYGYLAPFEYLVELLPNASCKILALQKRYLPLPINLAIAKNSSYRHILNHGILCLRDSGVLQKARMDTWPPDVEPEVSSLGSVKVGRVVPLLALLAHGVLVAFLMLGGECILFWLQRRWNYPPRTMKMSPSGGELIITRPIGIRKHNKIQDTLRRSKRVSVPQSYFKDVRLASTWR